MSLSDFLLFLRCSELKASRLTTSNPVNSGRIILKEKFEKSSSTLSIPGGEIISCSISACMNAELFGVSNSEVFAVSHAVKLVELSEVRDLGTGVERNVEDSGTAGLRKAVDEVDGGVDCEFLEFCSSFQTRDSDVFCS